MSEDSTALDPYYQQAREFAREIVTLIKFAEEHGSDGGHEIRTQIRQQVREWETEGSQMRTWLLIEVLSRSVAATYDDLADWSEAVLNAVADEERRARDLQVELGSQGLPPRRRTLPTRRLRRPHPPLHRQALL